MEYTNEELDGKKVAKWDREEVHEIVIAQVVTVYFFILIIILENQHFILSII